MKLPRRLLVLAAAVVGLLALAVWLVLLPAGLLEESAGPLDGLLPSDLDAAVRFDPDALTWSDSVRALREGLTPEGASAPPHEARLLAPLRELEDRLGRATLGLAPTVGRDVLGLEAVVAVRGADVLLLTRLTGRGKLLDAAARLDTADLRAAGLTLRGRTATLERDGAPAIHLQRVRDVLAVSTAPDMLATAAALGEPPPDLPRGRSRYADALGGTAPPGGRAYLWAAPGALGALRDADVPGLDALWPLLPPDAVGEVTATIDVSAPDRIAVHVEGAFAGDRPPSLDLLAEGGGGGGAGELRAVAEGLAVPGEALAVAGLSVRAEDVVRALADAQPPSRRELLDELLAERDLTVEEVAARIALHLGDGVAVVVARLPEADALELDDPRAGGVHAIPATLVAFRLRGGSAADDAIAAIAEEAESLFGSPLRTTPEEAAGGARIHRLERNRFGGEWELLRPAVAVVDGLLVFCTHDGHLLRALERRAAGDVALDVDPAETLALRVDGGPLRAHLLDQRWAWADRATRHDWRAERVAIRAELDASGSILRPEDRLVYENARIEARVRRRNEDEFPAALRSFRERWRPLGVLSGVRATADVGDTGFRLFAEILLAR